MFSNMHGNTFLDLYILLPWQRDHKATNKWCKSFLLFQVYQDVKYEENPELCVAIEFRFSYIIDFKTF